MKMKLCNKIIALSLASVMLLTSCGPSKTTTTEAQGETKASGEQVTETRAADAKIKDTLTIAYWTEPTGLDPQANGLQIAAIVIKEIFDTLVITDADGKIQPSLATKWELIDDLTMRFYLRDDVTFSNGDKMTADDVIYSIKRAQTEPTSASNFAAFDADNSKKIDDYTVDIKLKEPYAPILNMLSTTRGSIVDKKVLEAIGKDEHNRTPIGTGPYKLDTWVAGSEIKLVKNDTYWGDAAKTNTVVFKIITESANRIIELETGKADLVYNCLPTDIARIEENKDLKIVTGQSFIYMTLTMNMQDETLKNQKLRDALTYAIDKKSIVEAFYGDTATPLNGVLPPLTPFYKEFEPAPYDVEKAKQMLAEAGYPDGLTLEFVCPPLEELLRVAEAVQNMWKKIGVTVNITSSEVAPFEKQGKKLQIGIRTGSANEASAILIIYDSKFGDRLKSDNKELDAMLAHARSLYKDDEREKAYAEVQEYLWNLHYTIPILVKDTIYALGKNVEGFGFDPSGNQPLSKVMVYE